MPGVKIEECPITLPVSGTISTEITGTIATTGDKPTSKYTGVRFDTAGSPEYYGFMDRDGHWYIAKVTDTETVFATGSSDLSGTWPNRGSLTYYEYEDVF